MFVEQIMIFALGFLCAGLLTLLFLPAFWRRAMTLSRRQIEMQIPLSMAEVVAERISCARNSPPSSASSSSASTR